LNHMLGIFWLIAAVEGFFDNHFIMYHLLLLGCLHLPYVEFFRHNVEFIDLLLEIDGAIALGFAQL
jgi:hypothetical protein